MLAAEGWQDAMDPLAWRAAAAALWMAIWWATEAVPVPVTAFIPLVLFEPLGISSLRDAAAPYANPIIYLFLGGFLMALALERWDLHRRIALAILDRTGTEGKRLILGFMIVCAGGAWWLFNQKNGGNEVPTPTENNLGGPAASPGDPRDGEPVEIKQAAA